MTSIKEITFFFQKKITFHIRSCKRYWLLASNGKRDSIGKMADFEALLYSPKLYMMNVVPSVGAY